MYGYCVNTSVHMRSCVCAHTYVLSFQHNDSIVSVHVHVVYVLYMYIYVHMTFILCVYVCVCTVCASCLYLLVSCRLKVFYRIVPRLRSGLMTRPSDVTNNTKDIRRGLTQRRRAVVRRNRRKQRRRRWPTRRRMI